MKNEQNVNEQNPEKNWKDKEDEIHKNKNLISLNFFAAGKDIFSLFHSCLFHCGSDSILIQFNQ